jgi:serine/threonine protein kinase
MDRHEARNEPEMGVADIAATAAVPALPPLRAATFPYHPGDVILPGYRLTKRLGSGGFGEVWRAEAPGGMGVAIKILANLGRREGGREYRALQTIKNIRHAHIVPLFGVWLKANDGRVLSETELLEAEKRILSVGQSAAESRGAGEPHGPAHLESLELIVAMGLGDQTLYDRLREIQRDEDRALPTEKLLPWMQQAALALDHFNSSSRRSAENSTAVQHCDIKPQNMLLVGDVVQVCDFGLARAQGEVRATSNTMASLAYAAPEMVSPPYDPSPATDQYSLAISYIELRTGRLPYSELTPITILRAKVDGQMDLSALEPAEARIIGRALAVDPAKRWQSCTEFVRSLRASVPHGHDSSHLDSLSLRAPDRRPERSGSPAAAAGPAWAETKTAADTPASAPTRAMQTVAVAPPAGARAPLSPRLRLGTAIALGAILLLAGGYAAFAPGTQPRLRQPPPPGAGGGTNTDLATTTTPQPAAPLARAAGLEERGDFVAAGQDYAAALADQPSRLATVLWSLQTKAADAGRPADCVPLLERLEQLYAASPPPQVEGISRWDVVNSLAWYMATRSAADAATGRKARGLATEALTLAGDDPLMQTQTLDTLAAAAARAGDMEEAVRRIDEAITRTQDSGQRAEFEKRRDRYQRGLAWDEP